ncbi:MAG: UDP-N-acetylmuramoyl-L-alanyl-D-glutamate--2,6-diaminopimelate ligase, partial [Candidatus Hydrogenedentota bacterium]
MRLSKLLEALQENVVMGNTEVEIRGITTDSRKVQPGDLFVAVAGTVEDGHAYMRHALERGAVALAGETLPSGLGETVFV